MAASSGPRHVSLLRGVNVGGKGMVRMAWLREAYESVGCEDVSTYLQSGNVVFRRSRAPTKVGAEIEALIKKDLGFDTKILDRTHADLERLLANDQFPDDDPSRRFVVFLSRTLTAAETAKLEAIDTGDEALAVGSRELHLSCPAGIGRSKMAIAIDKVKLDVVATTRNWRTVSKLAEMSAPTEKENR